MFQRETSPHQTEARILANRKGEEKLLTTTTTSLSSVLNEGALMIQEQGWWVPLNKRAGRKANGNICALLAIGDDTDAVVYFARYLGCESHTREECAGFIGDWNDAQPDAQTVIGKLREAARAA